MQRPCGRPPAQQCAFCGKKLKTERGLNIHHHYCTRKRQMDQEQSSVQEQSDSASGKLVFTTYRLCDVYGASTDVFSFFVELSVRRARYPSLVHVIRASRMLCERKSRIRVGTPLFSHCYTTITHMFCVEKKAQKTREKREKTREALL